jgi:UDP-glucose 4-epimerase
LIETAIKAGVRQFIFSSTCAVYGNPTQGPVTRGHTACTDLTLWLVQTDDGNDAGAVHDLRYVTLRYFNVAGAPPGQGGR